MNIKFLLTYTYPDSKYERWHSRSLNAIARYCSIHNYHLEIVNKNHHMIHNSLLSEGDKLNALLRKAVRYYDAARSNADYFVLIDLDTLVLDFEKNIAKLIEPKKNYMSQFVLNAEKKLTHHWKTSKIELLKIFTGEENQKELIDCDTGFSCVTKEFCTNFVDYLSDSNLDLTSDTGLNNIYDMEKEIVNRIGGKGHTISDEHLLCLMYSNTNAERCLGVKNNNMCSSPYNVYYEPKYEDNEAMKNKYPLQHYQSVEKMMFLNCIFHHMIGGPKEDNLFKLFQ